jgi:tetratricopeptide (TPR) repeat protein
MRAEANLQLAAEAFDDVFGRVTGAPLSGSLDAAMGEVPGNLGSRPVVGESDAAILQGLLAFYDQFATKNEGDLRWQRETARAFRRSGEIQFRLGNNQEADDSFRRALTIYNKLLVSEPTKAEYIAGVAATRNQLASVAAETGRMDLARQESQRAWQELLRHPANLISPAICQIELARAYNRYAITASSSPFPSRSNAAFRGPPSDPREFLQKSITITEKLLQESPGQIEYSLTMADSYRYLWGVESLRKRFTEAQQARDRAIKILEDLAAAVPTEAECQFMLVQVYLLPFRFGMGEPSDSELVPQADRAVKISTELVNRLPQVPKHQVVLAQSLGAAARARRQIGEDDDAGVILDQAIALQQKIVEQFPSRGRYRLELVRYLEERVRHIRANGRPKELLIALEELIAAMERVPDSYRNFPSSRRSRAKAYADYAEVLQDQGKSEEAQLADAKAKELASESSPRPNRTLFRPSSGTPPKSSEPANQ